MSRTEFVDALTGIPPAISVFAEVVEKVIASVREHLEELLANPLSHVEALAEEERQALDQAARARMKTWEVARPGPYLMNLAEDGPFGRQPVPPPEDPPAQFDADRARRMLERHWSKEQPGIGDDGEPIVSWLDQQDVVEPLAVGDETGVVSELEEREPVA
jgi:hypothetical protein